MTISEIHRVENEAVEKMLLDTHSGEWFDGTPVYEWKPSLNSKTFKGFPYWLIVEDDGDVTWAKDNKELMSVLEDEDINNGNGNV